MYLYIKGMPTGGGAAGIDGAELSVEARHMYTRGMWSGAATNLVGVQPTSGLRPNLVFASDAAAPHHTVVRRCRLTSD